MKSIRYAAFATLLLATSGLLAQSLGDVARQVRKNKAETATASRHYDNDNLPTSDNLSVVGPPPSGDGANDAQAPNNSSAALVEKQKAADAWQKKIADNRQKVDSLKREIELDQREMRLRAAAQYTDPMVSVRDVNWTKDDAKYRNDLDAKQKQLADAQKEMDDTQDAGHKAGYVEAPADQGKGSDNGGDNK